jgi:MFS family permease
MVSGRVLLGAMALMSVWVASRFILGAAGAAVLPLSVHLLTQAMSGARLVKGLGVAISGWGTGMTLAMLGAVPLLHLFGSRTVMLASAALGLAVVAGLKWALPRSSRAGDRAAAPNLLRLLREFGANPALNIADAGDDVMQRGGADRGRSDSYRVAEAQWIEETASFANLRGPGSAGVGRA